MAVRWPFIGRRTELERVGDAAADPRCRAVLVCGRPGTGKSRLVEEYLDLARSGGHRTAHLAAGTSAAAVPLSVLAPLLPPQDAGTPTDPRELFALVRSRTVEQSGGRRFVLGVDDLHLLDPASLALLTALCAQPEVLLVATVRDRAPLPDTLAGWWRSGRALRLDLAELERPTADTLLHLALGAPVAAPAAEALWTASRGNLLYLRELVLHGVADGALAHTDGVWCLTARLSAGGGVADLVRERLEGLTDDQRGVLERLALCEPLGVDELLTHTTEPLLTALEETGLITVRPDGCRLEARLAHPVHADILRAGIPRLRARSLLLDQISRTESYGARRTGDPLRLAGWRLDATGTADPALLLRAARLAHYAHDIERMHDLARAALRHGPDPRAQLLLGIALGELGRADEAAEVLGDALDRVPEEELEALAITLALNCFYGSPGLAAARDRLRQARERGGAPVRTALTAFEALLVSLAGRTTEAAALLATVDPAPTGAASADGSADGSAADGTPGDGTSGGRGEQDGAPSRCAVVVAAARFRVLLAGGRIEAAAVLGRTVFELHRSAPERTGLSHPAGRLSELAGALLELGAFADARAAVLEGQALALRDGVTSLTSWFPLQLGRIALARGRAESAALHFRESLAQARSFAVPAATVGPLAGLVLAAAALGRPDPDAETALRALAGPTPAGPDTVRALAWADTVAGRPHRARAALLAAAGSALAAGERTTALVLCHDLARLGAATEAHALLTRTDDLLPDAGTSPGPDPDGPYATARLAHLRALARGSAAELADAAQALTDLGADLVAAESWIAAAERYRRDGASRPAAHALARAEALRADCEGAATPGLTAAVDALTPLTAREREIARLAAAGTASRAIAEGLHLSVRTVDNHLQNIYGKLGVTGRNQLAAALGESAAEAPPAPSTPPSPQAPAPHAPAPHAPHRAGERP
ncbi:LuxR C-terminal-related transcriptional regulator [Kitasatospora sp. NPDC088134]|uniref:LuxR C-terminal-related transcriptional regulator n=1 Tax=Kitasatospora sp. NPDC088134 TaxID=3364071 RepID=UPI00382F0662